MANNPGIGAMISMFGGNALSVAAFVPAIGKKIVRLWLDDAANDGNGALRIRFADGTGIMLSDQASYCCERRYMKCDDDLDAFVGSTLVSAETRDGGSVEDKYGEESETMFLVVSTSLGEFTINTHNDHNGYYGGISIMASVDND